MNTQLAGFQVSISQLESQGHLHKQATGSTTWQQAWPLIQNFKCPRIGMITIELFLT